MENTLLTQVRELVEANDINASIVRECVVLYERWANMGNLSGDEAMSRLGEILLGGGY
jgi:hypothetical protein